jgi:hypothetical protein
MDVVQITKSAQRGQLSRAQVYQTMMAHAEAQRGPGESAAQSFARFVKTPEGYQLFQVQKQMPGRDIDPDIVMNKSDASTTSQWDDLIKVTMKALRCSESQAITAALSTEGGQYAFSKRKRADQINTGQFTVADMQALDAAAAEQARHSTFAKREQLPDKTDFDVELAHVQQTYPHLTQSQAHDVARSRNPEAWEAHKKLNKLGMHVGTLPQHTSQYQTSGEAPPNPMSGRDGKAPPQRQQTHGSSPTTPARRPAPADDTPTVKRLLEERKRAADEALHQSVVSICESGALDKAALIKQTAAQYTNFVLGVEAAE